MSFSLKKVTKKQLAKSLKKLKKKMSAGCDGLSQDKLVLGSRVLVGPLLKIVNKSIANLYFP